MLDLAVSCQCSQLRLWGVGEAEAVGLDTAGKSQYIGRSRIILYTYDRPREALPRQNLRFRLRTSLVPPKYWLSEVVVADLLIVSSCSQRRSAKTEAKILTQILHFTTYANDSACRTCVQPYWYRYTSQKCFAIWLRIFRFIRL